MAYKLEEGEHTYLYEVDYGEELQAARIVVSCDAATGEGLFLVKASGQLEAADDLPGFSANPLHPDGIWPEPPAEAIADAKRIAEVKVAQ